MNIFSKVCPEMNLPEKGRYGVGMLFFSNNESEQKEIETHLNEFIEQEGQTLLAGEHVPVNVEKIGKVGKETCPTIRQVFIGASEDIQDDLAFERKLFVIQKTSRKLGRRTRNSFLFCKSFK